MVCTRLSPIAHTTRKNKTKYSKKNVQQSRGGRWAVDLNVAEYEES